MTSAKMVLKAVGAVALSAMLVTGFRADSRAAELTCDNLGPHPSHTARTVVHAALGCDECHAQACSAQNPNVVFGSLARAGGASPTWDPTARTCSNVYCHGSSPLPPTWTYADPTGQANCGACHGYPPASHDPTSTQCSTCHSDTVLPDGTINLAGGKHINGSIEATGCNGCHAFPPATGAHLAHADPAARVGNDLLALQDREPPGTSPTSAPAVYGFGCKNCHPISNPNHNNPQRQVALLLYESTGTSGSLKARNAPTAAYDPATKTCSGVYCHSTGQAAPSFKTTPAWDSTGGLPCSACHDNPPAYDSGGAGSATANSHLNLADDGYEFGHFLGMPGAWHTSKHGGNGWGPGEDAAPITCQACHYDTTDPANTGPSGFYYLDTTGSYALPGGDPGRISWGWQASIQCGSCHNANTGLATGTGRVLPLRHVNGTRDVVFDPRTTLPSLSWLPAAPNNPAGPYWMTGTQRSLPYPSWVTWSPSNTTVSFSLSESTYDPATKTCSNVACHLAEQDPVWGRPYQYYTNSSATCYTCHPM